MLNVVHVFHLGIIIFNIILEHIDAVPSSHMFKNTVVVGSGPLHLQPFTSLLKWNLQRLECFFHFDSAVIGKFKCLFVNHSKCMNLVSTVT